MNKNHGLFSQTNEYRTRRILKNNILKYTRNFKNWNVKNYIKNKKLITDK